MPLGGYRGTVSIVVKIALLITVGRVYFHLEIGIIIDIIIIILFAHKIQS